MGSGGEAVRGRDLTLRLVNLLGSFHKVGGEVRIPCSILGRGSEDIERVPGQAVDDVWLAWKGDTENVSSSRGNLWLLVEAGLLLFCWTEFWSL